MFCLQTRILTVTRHTNGSSGVASCRLRRTFVACVCRPLGVERSKYKLFAKRSALSCIAKTRATGLVLRALRLPLQAPLLMPAYDGREDTLSPTKASKSLTREFLLPGIFGTNSTPSSFTQSYHHTPALVVCVQGYRKVTIGQPRRSQVQLGPDGIVV